MVREFFQHGNDHCRNLVLVQDFPGAVYEKNVSPSPFIIPITTDSRPENVLVEPVGLPDTSLQEISPYGPLEQPLDRKSVV